MGLGAGEAEKKAKELVEKMVRWKFGKNTKLDCSVIMSISRALTRLWNGNAKYGILWMNFRRTNLTASEVTKLLNIYSTTMVSLLLSFPFQIVLFVTFVIATWFNDNFQSLFLSHKKSLYKIKTVVSTRRRASLWKRWTGGSSSSSSWTTSRSLRASSWTGIWVNHDN